jgi:hypothetical protein
MPSHSARSPVVILHLTATTFPWRRSHPGHIPELASPRRPRRVAPSGVGAGCQPHQSVATSRPHACREKSRQTKGATDHNCMMHACIGTTHALARIACVCSGCAVITLLCVMRGYRYSRAALASHASSDSSASTAHEGVPHGGGDEPPRGPGDAAGAHPPHSLAHNLPLPPSHPSENIFSSFLTTSATAVIQTYRITSP